ncbi:MAG: hypothetical protein ACQPRJ_06285 [Solitalea-like symbiont of Acarus siro]
MEYMKTCGFLTEISDKVRGSGNLKTRQFTINCALLPEYPPDLIKFDLLYSGWDMMYGMQIGDLINVNFVLRGVRSKGSRNFNVLLAVSVEKIEAKKMKVESEMQP